MGNSKNLYVFVEATDISAIVSDQDKKLIEDMLDTNSKVGMYLDINLFKQIEGENKVKVEEINVKVKISFEIPENLRSSNRTFYIIRVHDGVATRITPTIDGNILTFETDKFSTYALAYTDAVEVKTTATADTKTEKSTSASEIVNKTSTNPKTGDNIEIWISLMIISILGFMGTIKFLKNNK